MCHVSSERTFMDFCPQWFLFFYCPQWIFTMSPRSEFFMDFCPQWSFIFIPSEYRVSLKSTFTDFTFNSFHFHFTFKSPTVLSSRGTLLRYCCDAWVYGLVSINLQMVSSIGFDLRCLRATKSKKGYCSHLNLYRSIFMVPGLSDDNLRSLIWRMCVENHLENSRKQVEKLPLNLIGVRPFEGGTRL